MKKLLLILLAFMICFVPNIKTVYADTLQVRVIYSSINVYSSDDITSSEKIATFKYNDIITVIQSINGADGYAYYLIELDGVSNYTQGYVFKSQVLDVTLASPTKRFDFNASIASECETYVLDGKNYVLANKKLTAGTKIKILSGYNSSNEYTQIQYAENEKIITAYVKTSAIAISGISTTLIGAIIIIVTSVSLVLIIFGIGKKNKVKKR